MLDRTIQRFLWNPSTRKVRYDKVDLKAVKVRDIRKIKCEVFKKPGSTSKAIFENSGLNEVPKTTHNRILRVIA